MHALETGHEDVTGAGERGMEERGMEGGQGGAEGCRGRTGQWRCCGRPRVRDKVLTTDTMGEWTGFTLHTKILQSYAS